jgi:DNA primase small subunit
MEDVILQYTYPRIDAEVSKHRNHLLKSPFVVHPGTGRVCVPVNPALAEEFDPETVPTVGELLHELNGIPAESEEAKGRKMEGESTARYTNDQTGFADRGQTTSTPPSSLTSTCLRSTSRRSSAMLV